MQDPELQHKLTAILYADVAGYSRLTGIDEAGTHRALGVSLDLIIAAVETHGGRTVHFAGDAVLAEFPSVVDALSCAVQVQSDLRTRHAEAEQERRVEFRIGINLGEVIVDRGDIYGDGVNVAARLESLAEPGGVCISRTVYEQVKKRLPLRYESMGERRVKNIVDPVHAYRVSTDDDVDQSGCVSLAPQAGAAAPQRRLWHLGFTAAMAILAVVGIGTWYLWTQTELAPGPKVSDLPYVESAAGGTGGLEMALSDHSGKPSIAVLPFTSIGVDEEQSVYADGITNDLITELSRFRRLLVTASNTVFTFKGKPVDIKDVARELGVRYVLEGSVELAGDALRINAQLIDGASGHHLWAERYERARVDFFSIRNEIVTIIVGKMPVEIDRSERERALRKATDDLDAHEYFMRGQYHYRRATRSDNRRARELFRKALDADPFYSIAYSALGFTYMRDFWYGWTEFPRQAVEKAAELARRALGADPTSVSAYRLLGNVHLYRREHEAAVRAFDNAVRLNPNDAKSLYGLGTGHLFLSDIEAAIPILELSRRLDPTDAVNQSELGLAYYLQGRYEEAIASLEQARALVPRNQGALLYLPAAYAKAGYLDDARDAAAQLRKKYPFYRSGKINLFRNPQHNAVVAEGLRMAGLE